MQKVVRHGETRLITDAVEADVKHVKSALGTKDKRIVNGKFVEAAVDTGCFQDQLIEFVWRAKWRKSVSRLTSRATNQTGGSASGDEPAAR
ncbi:hypothetical protein GCM10008942_38170 [Rhizomicrobium electricum]|uniref:Uncharacterized protein n=1 Tax=Rhizomicrobium electricum TaxID=480070 RepID=A0ABP3Q8Y6_9PROT